MSVRQQIVDAMAVRLGLIASGYEFTLNDGSSYVCASTPLTVTAWKRTPYQSSQVPAISFWDTAQSLGDGPIGFFEHRLEMTIAGFVTGSTSLATARDMLADICAAIGSDPKWGGLAKWTEITAQNLNAAQEGEIVAGCEVQIVVVYETALWRM